MGPSAACSQALFPCPPPQSAAAIPPLRQDPKALSAADFADLPTPGTLSRTFAVPCSVAQDPEALPAAMDLARQSKIEWMVAQEALLSKEQQDAKYVFRMK